MLGVLSLPQWSSIPSRPCLLPLAHGCSLDKQTGPARIRGDSFRLHDHRLCSSPSVGGDSCSLLGPLAYMCVHVLVPRSQWVVCFALSSVNLILLLILKSGAYLALGPGHSLRKLGTHILLQRLLGEKVGME